jgi:hypothetical protein
MQSEAYHDRVLRGKLRALEAREKKSSGTLS